MHVRVILLENFSSCSPGLCALVFREETPSPLPFGCLMDGLPQLTRKYYVMVALGLHTILLFSSSGSPALHVIPFHLSVSYQACMETPLPEFHMPS